MKGLVGYHLLNAAAFQNSSCEVDGHFQYIGTNGNGKTTNLRIPLYFYNPSGIRSDHAIEQSKRPFNDFYFKGLHSFVIFEVRRGTLPDGSEDRYHIAVCRKGGRPPSFIFIDAPYKLDLFRSITGKLCNENELMKNLLNHGIPSQTVHSYEDFKGIIYGTNTASKFIPYVFAIPKHSAVKSIYTIPRILSSIFRSETMKTETLKDALIASLGIEEDQLSIDLHNTSKELKQFESKRRDVQQIKGMRDRLKFILDDYRRYQDSQTTMQSLAGKIKAALPKVTLAIETNSAAKQTAEQNLQREEKAYKQQEERLTQEQSDLDKEFGGKDHEIKGIEESQKRYPQEEVAKWEQSEQERPQAQEKLQAYADELKILNKQFANIEEKYTNLKNTKEKVFTARRQEYEIAKSRKENEHQEAINAIHKNRRNAHKNLEDQSNACRQDLDEAFTEAQQRRTQLQNKLDGLSPELFRKTEIQAISHAIKELSDQSVNNTHALNAMPDKAKVIEQQHVIQQTELKDTHGSKIQSRRNELDKVQAQIEKERPLVERYHDSFLDHADQNDLSTDAMRSLVREEVLLMPAGDLLTKGDSPKNALLGTQINLGELPPAPELNYEQAKLRLEELRKLHEEQSALLSDAENAYGNALKQLEKSYEQERQAHVQRLSKLREESKTLATELEIQNRALDTETGKRDKAYQEELTLTKEQQRSASENFKRISEECEQFSTTLSEKRKKLNEAAAKEEEKVEKLIEELGSNLQRQLKELKEEQINAVADLQEKKQEEIQSGSSNPKRIEDLSRKHEEATTVLNNLKADIKDLESYRQHVLPRIQKLPELTKQLDSIKEAQIRLKSRRDALATEKTEALKALKDKLNQHTQLHNDAIKDDLEFTSWAKIFPKFASAEEGSKLITYTPGDLVKLTHLFREEAIASEQLWNGTKEDSSKNYGSFGIAQNARKVIKPFSQGNLYGFPEQLDSDDEIHEFIQDKIEPLLTTDVIERERKQILNSFLLTMKSISSDYADMERHKGQLQRTLTGVQRSITGKRIFVSAIENIEFRMETSKSRFGTLRENLKTCIDKLDTLDLEGSAQDDLFRRHPNSREIQILLDQVQTLCNEIADHKINRISLGDLFEMQIRITENGNIHPWKSSVHGIGSEGTDTLAKIMIYVGILSHFKDSAFKNADELHLHCLVDEIGRIHSDYISELLHFCNERGIFLATASPETHRRPGDFQNTYLIERSADQRHAKIQKVLQVGVSVT